MKFKLFGYEICIEKPRKPVVIDLSDMEDACRTLGFERMCSNPRCGCPMMPGETMCPDCGSAPKWVDEK